MTPPLEQEKCPRCKGKGEWYNPWAHEDSTGVEICPDCLGSGLKPISAQVEASSGDQFTRLGTEQRLKHSHAPSPAPQKTLTDRELELAFSSAYTGGCVSPGLRGLRAVESHATKPLLAEIEMWQSSNARVGELCDQYREEAKAKDATIDRLQGEVDRLKKLINDTNDEVQRVVKEALDA